MLQVSLGLSSECHPSWRMPPKVRRKKTVSLQQQWGYAMSRINRDRWGSTNKAPGLLGHIKWVVKHLSQKKIKRSFVSIQARSRRNHGYKTIYSSPVQLVDHVCAQTIFYCFWWETVHIVEEFHLELDTSHLFHTKRCDFHPCSLFAEVVYFLLCFHYMREEYRTMPVARCMDLLDLTEIIMSIHGSVARCHFYPGGCDVAIPWSFWNLEEAARSSSEWGWLHLLPWRRFRRSVFTCKK